MAKLQKISKIALSILKVFKILAILILILGIAAPILFFFVPEMGSPTGLHLGAMEFTLDEISNLQIPSGFIFSLFLANILCTAVGIWIISLLQNILRPMAEGRPFDHQIAPSIRKIAWLHMIAAFLAQAAGWAVSVFTFLQMQNASPSGAFLDLQLNCNFLVTFGILFLLSYVFEYGQELQKLSDETV